MNSRITWKQVRSFLVVNSLFAFVLAAPAWAFPTDLSFDEPVSNTLPDGDQPVGQGTGFDSVQQSVPRDSSFIEYDKQGIDLVPLSSVLKLKLLGGSHFGNANGSNTLKNGLQVPIDSQSQPFTITTRLQGPLGTLNVGGQQAGIFLGSDQDNYVKLVFIRINATPSSPAQWGIQFFEEYMDGATNVRSSVGGGNLAQIPLSPSDVADINSLDLFIKGDPFTGRITAAYRINSGTVTPIPLRKELQIPNSTPADKARFSQFFAPQATARAGILAFTPSGDSATTVTFNRFDTFSNPTKFTWRQTNTLAPLGRSEGPSAMVDGNLYVFGGFNANSRMNDFIPSERSSYRYNPATDTWSQPLEPIPVATTHAGTATDGKNIYIAGGVVPNGKQVTLTEDGVDGGSRNVWKYNIANNSWTDMPPLPQPRGAGEMSFLDGKLYYFGGTNLDRTNSVGDESPTPFPNHWVLDLANLPLSWQELPNLPVARNHLADAVINGKIYAIGGQTSHNADLKTLNNVHMYDPIKKTWTAVASMPPTIINNVRYGRSHAAGATFVMDDRIIVVGGEYDHDRSINDVTAYDPVRDVWTQLSAPLPVINHSGYAGSFGTKIFYTLGSGGGAFPRVTRIATPNP